MQSNCQSQVPVTSLSDYATLFEPHNPGTLPPHFSVHKALAPCVPNRGLPHGNYNLLGPLAGAQAGVAGSCGLPTVYTPAMQRRTQPVSMPGGMSYPFATQTYARTRKPFLETLF